MPDLCVSHVAQQDCELIRTLSPCTAIVALATYGSEKCQN